MKISNRLKTIVDALPLQSTIRILEIGCGPDAAAWEIANRNDDGHILAIDHTKKAIERAIKNSKAEIESGILAFPLVGVENPELQPNEKHYDIAFALRVGVLDGRHPKLGKLALPRIAKALAKNGKLFIDGGNPIREISLEKYR